MINAALRIFAENGYRTTDLINDIENNKKITKKGELK